VLATPLWLGSLLAGSLLVGCNSSPESSAPGAAATDTFVLAERPAERALTPTQVMERGGEPAATVLAGRIDAGDMDPFQSGQLAFMVSQLPDRDHAGGDPDHADNCPFCKRKLENAPKAIVQFRDASGEVLPGDARQGLGLGSGDVVYVTGSAWYDESVDSVMVDATGVYRTDSP
jgi:hypothetical protein